MLWFLAALGALPWAPCAQAQSQPEVTLVFDSEDPSSREISTEISKEIAASARLSKYDVVQLENANPIEKGRFLAALERQRLIVPIGDEPTQYITAEVEDTPIYFVSAGLVSGGALASRGVSGIFSYNIEELASAAAALKLEKIGLVYVRGYEPVAQWIRQAAARRGLVLSVEKIGEISGYAPALRRLFRHCDVLWVLGDPTLVRGAGLEFLRENSLSHQVPVIANTLWDVRNGDLIAFKPQSGDMASTAGRTINLMLAGALTPETKFAPAPPSDVFIVNDILIRKWNIHLPQSGRFVWQTTK